MKKLRASSYLNHVEIGDGTSLLYSGSTQCIDLVPTEYANLLSDGADVSFLLLLKQSSFCNADILRP